MKEILKNNRLKAFLLLAVLFLFLFYASIPFISAFLGAIIIFALINPINRKLKNKFSKTTSAVLSLLISILIIVVPLVILIFSINRQISNIQQNISELRELIGTIQKITPFEINREQVISRIAGFVSDSIGSVVENIVHVAIILFLMYFILYYLFKHDDKFIEKTKNALPFNKKNSEKTIKMFYDITYATIWGSVIIAIVQGTLLGISFAIVGIPAPIFWGFITAILSFIPILGSPLVFLPAAGWLFLEQNYTGMIIILAFGIVISTIDNVIRPITNRKFGSVHPLISIIGIFIGISQFGFVGIFIGPLLVAYLVVFWRIYREEYLDKN